MAASASGTFDGVTVIASGKPSDTCGLGETLGDASGTLRGLGCGGHRGRQRARLDEADPKGPIGEPWIPKRRAPLLLNAGNGGAM